MATRKGDYLEISFRTDFNIDPSIDVLTLMEAAIDVASSTRPLEFSNRMDRILRNLNMIIGPIRVEECASCTTDDGDDQKKKIANKSSDPPQELVNEDDDRKNVRPKKSDDRKHLCTKKGVRDEDEAEKKELDSEFEDSRRKFQEVGFEEIRQRKRKIRVLGITKDVPRTRVRLVH